MNANSYDRVTTARRSGILAAIGAVLHLIAARMPLLRDAFIGVSANLNES